jgi:hypothetical protein
MSTRTIYKCDHCGKETENDEQFWLIGFVVTTKQWLGETNTLHHKREWCRECCEEFGILPRSAGKPQVPEAEKPKLIEDMIREIVREEVEAGR